MFIEAKIDRIAGIRRSLTPFEVITDTRAVTLSVLIEFNTGINSYVKFNT